MPTGGGTWTEQVLHSFNLDGTDGGQPYAGLVFDGSGNLYGTTYVGGSNYVWDTVFELSPIGGGNWAETVLHSFNFDGTDGYNPQCTLVFDVVGNLYGTTNYGGSYGGGIVFELSRSGGGGRSRFRTTSEVRETAPTLRRDWFCSEPAQTSSARLPLAASIAEGQYSN